MVRELNSNLRLRNSTNKETDDTALFKHSSSHPVKSSSLSKPLKPPITFTIPNKGDSRDQRNGRGGV